MANRTPRRRKSWAFLLSSQVDLTGDATAAGPSLFFPESGSTILRMLGEYNVGLTPGGTFAASDEVVIGLGLAILSTDAVALGATAFPDPIAEPDYPWVYWAVHPISVFDASPMGIEVSSFLRHRFDIRSMRKVGARESLVWVAEYADISGTPPVTVNWGSTRVLRALP